MKTKLKPRRSAKTTSIPPSPLLSVDKIPLRYNNNVKEEELVCCLMGKVGFSGRLISEKTGMSLGQVYKTLSRAKIKLWDFRHGKSKWGKSVSAACIDRVAKGIKE